jgi:hypothetical protein
LKDTVKDPLVIKRAASVAKRETTRKPPAGNNRTIFKIVLSLVIGFAGGLVTGRFIRIL